MFVGVVVENFHRCREEQEKEERARRLAKRARKMEKKRKSKLFCFLRFRYPSQTKVMAAIMALTKMLYANEAFR